VRTPHAQQSRTQFPYKPSPIALQHICESWGIQPSEVIMVGDSAKDDIVCGNCAGAVTVLLDSEGRYSVPEGAATLQVRPCGCGRVCVESVMLQKPCLLMMVSSCARLC
jgi:histidinol phosphatase-like enzyme